MSSPKIEKNVLAKLNLKWIGYSPFVGRGFFVIFATSVGIWKILMIAGDHGTEVINPKITKNLLKIYYFYGAIGFAAIAFGISLLIYLLITVLVFLRQYLGYILYQDNYQNFYISRGVTHKKLDIIDPQKFGGLEITQSLTLRIVRGAKVKALVNYSPSLPLIEGTFPIFPPTSLYATTIVAKTLSNTEQSIWSEDLFLADKKAKTYHILTYTIPSVIFAILLLRWEIIHQKSLLFIIGAIVIGMLGYYYGKDHFKQIGYGFSKDLIILQSGTLERIRVGLPHRSICGWEFKQNRWQQSKQITNLNVYTSVGKGVYSCQSLSLSDALNLAKQNQPGIISHIIKEETYAN